MPRINALFVCTANICRSPYAEAAFNHAARMHQIDAVAAGAGVRVDLLDVAGQPTCPEMPYDQPRPADIVIPRPAQHSATQLDADLVRSADLIVVFEPSHRSHVVQLHPRAQLRTYSLRQLERLASAISADEWPDSAPAPTGDVLRDLNLARSWAPYRDDDSVPDPHGHGVEAHKIAANVVDDCIAALMTAIKARHVMGSDA